MAVDGSQIKDYIDSSLANKGYRGIRTINLSAILKSVVDWITGVANQAIGAAQTAAVDVASNVAAQFKGPYSPGSNYLKGDRVVIRGSTYSVTAPFTASALPDRSKLTLVVRGLFWTGAHGSSTQYFVDDLATQGGNIYRRKTDGVSGVSIAEGADWELYLQGVSVADGTVSRAKLDAALQALLDAVAMPGYEEAPYAYARVDQARRIAYFVDLAGKFGLPLVPDVAGAILALQAQGLMTWPAESGYAYAHVDEAMRAAYGVDTDGNLMIRGVRFPGRVINRLPTAIIASQDVVCFGDSMSESGYPEKLAALYAGSRTVENMGIWGATSAQIAFWMGATGGLLQVAGNQIPASGPVAVTPVVATLLQTSYPRSRTGMLMGIPGTLARDAGNNYTFTRTTSGAAVVTDGQVMFCADNLGHDYKTAVIWIGHNDYYLVSNPTAAQLTSIEATVLANIAAAVSWLKSVHKRFVVVSIHPKADSSMPVGSGVHNSILSVNNELRSRYPRQYFNSFEFFKRNPNPGVAQDAIDAANGVVPGSYRTDSAHLSDAGKLLMAQGVQAKINELIS